MLKEAGYWHERAGDAYLSVPARVMGAEEKAYYALIEYRSALQDYVSGPRMLKAAKSYLKALDTCLKGGKEGYSHEMLFAGHLSAKVGLFRKAAGFFQESAKQFEQESKLTLAREMRKLAESYSKLGRKRSSGK
jgi:tetratricopeptide (TPR) repeat protein